MVPTVPQGPSSAGRPRYRRADVVDRALVVLDRYGLGDLSMRRLGAELGVQPSALYHHFADKQTLLAAAADEILARGPRREVAADARWDARVVAVCHQVRDAALAYRDGAEVVATAYAFGTGAVTPYDDLVAALRAGGADDLAPLGARTLLHFVLGHVADEQTHLQASSAGAISDLPRDRGDFDLALEIVLDGLRVRVDA